MSRSNSVIIKGRIAIDLVVLPLCAIDINSKIKQIFIIQSILFRYTFIILVKKNTIFALHFIT